jgi:hypothetical protein
MKIKNFLFKKFFLLFVLKYSIDSNYIDYNPKSILKEINTYIQNNSVTDSDKLGLN